MDCQARTGILVKVEGVEVDVTETKVISVLVGAREAWVAAEVVLVRPEKVAEHP
jgi:hypothetical protein